MGRPQLEHVHSPLRPWEPAGWPGWPAGAQAKVLSRDDGSGALSALARLPAGSALAGGAAVSDLELLVLGGALEGPGGERRGRLHWSWTPAGEAVPPLVALEEAELLVLARSGPPGIGAVAAPGAGSASGGALALDTEAMPWTANPVDDGPPVLRVKVLRIDPVTGGLHALVHDGTVPYSAFEFHDCVEEVFLVEGDLTLGNSGEMLPGSYFSRPPYITHGMSTSREGSLYYVYTDSTLVNHRTDRMTRTAAENRAQVSGY